MTFALGLLTGIVLAVVALYIGLTLLVGRIDGLRQRDEARDWRRSQLINTVSVELHRRRKHDPDCYASVYDVDPRCVPSDVALAATEYVNWYCFDGPWPPWLSRSREKGSEGQ